MLANYDPDWNIDDLTDSEIYAAIRYLEPGLTNADQPNADDQDKDPGVVTWICLYVALLICFAFLGFYWG